MEKKVLLFSGGFDSTLQEWLIKPDVLLYVDMKTSYSEVEIEFLKTLPTYYTDRLIIKECPLGEYERENKYLPYRNLILGTLAMEYGQHVYFGFNEADNAPDKDDLFLKRITSLFKHLNVNCIGDMGWENRKFSFNAPFKHLTKTELVAKCLKKGMDPEVIRHIRSCYDGVSKIGCGVCRPCINRAVSLINNGIYSDDLFDAPVTPESIKDLIKKTEESDHSKNYYADLKKAYKRIRQKG